jgi:4-nitrophenyl phosphatase
MSDSPLQRVAPEASLSDGDPLPPIAALAFDLDGTIYLGSQLLPGAGELIEALVAARVPHLFATNNSSKTLDEYLAHLGALGLPVTPAAVLTSNDVAIDHLRTHGFRRPYLLANHAVEHLYREAGFDLAGSDPDAVLLTFDTSLTYLKLRRASDLIRAGLPYFATHPDLVCPTPEGPIPDCGAFAALLAASSERWPVVLGKPEAAMASTIGARLGVPRAAIAFVGDRLYTDVRMAREQGFQAVLTLTGEATRADVAAAPHPPHRIVGDLTELHAQLRSQGLVV